MSESRGVKSSETNWGAIRAKLARAIIAADQAVQPGSAQAKTLLDERARRLARPPAEEPQPGEVLVLATFSLASERYGIEARFVREIVRFLDFTPVPGAGDFLVGVTNLRSEILPVINLRAFFGVSERGITDLSRVVVIGDRRNELGILADQVHDIVPLREDEVLEAPASESGARRQHVRGVTNDALIVLDGAQLLVDPRLYVDQSRNIELAERPKKDGGT